LSNYSIAGERRPGNAAVIAARECFNCPDNSTWEIPFGVKQIKLIVACLVGFLTISIGIDQWKVLNPAPFPNYNFYSNHIDFKNQST
jgi:hypothetical protein